MISKIRRQRKLIQPVYESDGPGFAHPPGWYPVNEDTSEYQYWDGFEWTQWFARMK